MVIFLDASFLIALYNEHDIHHMKAVSISERISKDEWGPRFTSDDVYDEIVSVALRKFGKETAVKFGKLIISSVHIINGDKHVFDESQKIFNSTEDFFSFTDCTTQAIMKLAEIEHIATFDKLFSKLDIKVIN